MVSSVCSISDGVMLPLAFAKGWSRNQTRNSTEATIAATDATTAAWTRKVPRRLEPRITQPIVRKAPSQDEPQGLGHGADGLGKPRAAALDSLVLFDEQLPERRPLDERLGLDFERQMSEPAPPVVDERTVCLLLHRGPGVMDHRAAVADQYALEALDLLR